jgi:hypothetical protein
MTRLEQLIDIKLAALFLQKNLTGRNREVVESAEADLARLVDRFFTENRDIVSPAQYETASQDYDYFLVLVETAIDHFRANKAPEKNRTA